MNRSKQESQFAEWLERHRLILLKVANAFATGADRDDLMQEMLLSLWKAMPSFRGDSKESTFTYRVVHNGALTWVRGEKRRRVREASAFDETSTERASTGNPQLTLLYECLRELPSSDRSLMTMSLDGLSHAEIGDVIGSKENAISVRIHRIRKKLATAMERKSK